ncbi:MAG: hypothetical protein V7K89_15350 [Nostoc sp.]|uniref:hypothetical protein n=1 Tax=Nostoc sp. TaxID=1180 RepID=UPI002FF861CE
MITQMRHLEILERLCRIEAVCDHYQMMQLEIYSLDFHLSSIATVGNCCGQI